MRQIGCNWLEDYLAGELPCDWEPLFEAHLTNCAECREEVTDWRLLNERLREASETLEVLPPEWLASLEQQHKHPGIQRPEPPRTQFLPAVIAVCLLAGLFLSLAPNQIREQKPPKVTETPFPPEVRVEVSENYISVPADVGDANITMVWIYPVVPPEKETE